MTAFLAGLVLGFCLGVAWVAVRAMREIRRWV